MIEVECMVEGVTVKKAVILYCFAFLCVPLYAASLGAMTASFSGASEILWKLWCM